MSGVPYRTVRAPTEYDLRAYTQHRIWTWLPGTLHQQLTAAPCVCTTVLYACTMMGRRATCHLVFVQVFSWAAGRSDLFKSRRLFRTDESSQIRSWSPSSACHNPEGPYVSGQEPKKKKKIMTNVLYYERSTKMSSALHKATGAPHQNREKKNWVTERERAGTANCIRYILLI